MNQQLQRQDFEFLIGNDKSSCRLRSTYFLALLKYKDPLFVYSDFFNEEVKSRIDNTTASLWTFKRYLEDIGYLTEIFKRQLVIHLEDHFRIKIELNVPFSIKFEVSPIQTISNKPFNYLTQSFSFDTTKKIFD